MRYIRRLFSYLGKLSELSPYDKLDTELVKAHTELMALSDNNEMLVDFLVLRWRSEEWGNILEQIDPLNLPKEDGILHETYVESFFEDWVRSRDPGLKLKPGFGKWTREVHNAECALEVYQTFGEFKG